MKISILKYAVEVLVHVCAFVWTYCTCWSVILVLYSYVCRDVFLEQHLGFGDTLFGGDIFGGLNLELGLELWSDYC